MKYESAFCEFAVEEKDWKDPQVPHREATSTVLAAGPEVPQSLPCAWQSLLGTVTEQTGPAVLPACISSFYKRMDNYIKDATSW